jgi:tetratricopeptide (TPR) repeat protein
VAHEPKVDTRGGLAYGRAPSPGLLRTAIAAVALAFATAGVLLGGVLGSEAPPPAAAPLESEAAADRVFARFGLGNTEAVVRELEAAVRQSPADAESLALLGLAFQQRARETADPSYYPRAEAALRRALAIAPRSALATSGLASLALSRHRFRDAVVLARRALALDASARNYGLLGDALVELGRYDQAFSAFDTMARLEPALPSYARVSYARELQGGPRAAIAPMRAAIAASGGEPEALAWSRVQLGKLFFSIGRLDAAERSYREALAAFPGYVFALEALAQTEAARGRFAKAIRLVRRAVERVPLPQFVATLADLYRASGRDRLARRQVRLMGAIQRLLAANGVNTDLELAQFNVDYGVRLPQSLALARTAWRARPSIYADDTVAWALVRTGRCGEALRYSRRALRLRTRDALKFFHRGMAERCLGHGAAARSWFRRALALNPHFSPVWAPVARRYAR